MNIKQSIDDKPANWEYLPDTTTLAQYLRRKDLIKLSKCCKRYRNQLERQVLEDLCLGQWWRDNQTIYEELEKSRNYKKILKYMKTDLGSKLKFARKFTLTDEANYPFAKKFVKLFPNILTLRLHEINLDNYFSERSLRTVLKGMKHLEHVELIDFWGSIEESKSKAQIFPKSLKSLKIKHELGFYPNNNNNIMIYDMIDSTYKKLYFLSITSDKMLQNLSCGMSNLKEAEIKGNGLDNTKLAKFLKSNPHLKKLNIYLEHYNEEIANTILSFKYLEHLYISAERWNEIQVNTLSSNHSIKFLSISKFIPGPLAFQLINSCKISEVLEFDHYYHRDLYDIDWSKLARRINILKLPSISVTPDTFEKIDTSRKFNQIHFKRVFFTIEKIIEEYNIDKLKNYKFTHSISRYCTLKLINKKI